MNDSLTATIVFLAMFLAFGAAMYALGRGHRPRTEWEEGYRKGAESIFKIAVRATTRTVNSAPGRFLPRMPSFGRARAVVAPVPSSIHNDTTIDLTRQVVLEFRPRGTVDPDADTEAA